MKYVIIFIIRLENTSKKIQSGRKVKKTKSSLLNIYLAKLDEVLGFTNKTKQIYNLNTVSQQTQNHNQKLKKVPGLPERFYEILTESFRYYANILKDILICLHNMFFIFTSTL